VSSTPRADRRNRAAPTRRSSSATAAETVGWLTRQARAAALKDPVRATAAT